MSRNKYRKGGGITASDATQPKPVAGIPMTDAKAQINEKKKDRLAVGAPTTDNTATPATPSFYGNDSLPAEANVVDDAPPTPAPTTVTPPSVGSDGTVTIKQDELNVLVAQRARQIATEVNQGLQDQLAAQRTEIDAIQQRGTIESQNLQAEVDKAQREVDRLKGVFAATGNSIPLGDTSNGGRYGFNINTLLLPSSQEAQGAAKDFIGILNNPQYTPRQQAFDMSDGSQYEQLDTTYLDRFVRENKKAVMEDMERLFKGNGFLRGNSMVDAKAGPTLGTAGSIAEAFLPFLSSIMRQSHVARYIFWQFVTTKLELGRVPGNNILVPRFQWLDDPTDVEDYILDSSTNSASISPESQALQMLTTPVELLGYGLGRGNKVGNRPIAIPEFISASSMVDLTQALQTRLGQNYNSLEDMIIRRVFQQTLANINNIYYNEAGNLTQTPTNINIGEDATLTEESLNSLSGEMTRRGIPTYDNGQRIGVLNTFGTTQLKNSLGDKMAAPNAAALEELTNILNAGSLGDGITKPSGYLGSHGGFMLFESGTTSVGNPGADGVNTINFGVGARTTRDSYFFGPGVVGKGVSLPMELRMDEAGTFGTKMRFIWRSIEGWGGLDVTSTNAGQQDRVLVLRTVDQPI